MASNDLMPIAIVGMACRLPGDCSTPDDFWKLLTKCRSGWSKIPKDRFNQEAYNHPNPEKKGTLNSQGGYFISQDLEMFDPAFFDMTKKEAETMGMPLLALPFPSLYPYYLQTFILTLV